MRIAFRVDASIVIGSGHVMRCLSLAEYLKDNGADVFFICRKYPGDLIKKIIKKGFQVFELKETGNSKFDTKLFHSHWLGVSQKIDAFESKEILVRIKPNWLVVDHYALDQEWEKELKHISGKIMVIDDLADRKHDCDILLDQTCGRKQKHYTNLVPKTCRLIVGAQYSLLRPEFLEWRRYSLKRRVNPELKSLLISMGGVDDQNHTEDVLHQLMLCSLPNQFKITVVLGALAPHLDSVTIKAKQLSCEVIIKVDVDNMAEIMANSDAAIGAAGTTSWERCCLGLPTIQIIVAENQMFLAKSLAKHNAAIILEPNASLTDLIRNPLEWMKPVSTSASRLTDGTGVGKVSSEMINLAAKSKTFFGVDLINYVELNSEDQAYVLKMRNNPAVKKWMYTQEEISQKQHQEFMDKLKGDRKRLYFLVRYKCEVIGCINFSDIGVNNSVKFGIFSNPFLENKGAGGILESLASDYAFYKLNVSKIRLEVFSSNTRAINFYNKKGFKSFGSENFNDEKICYMEKIREPHSYELSNHQN